jgi:localization factor PodJL
MSSKRSNLDSLNAGRLRGPHTSLEDLNLSLESLGQRLERNEEARPEPRGPNDDPHAGLQMPPARATPDAPYPSHARDADRLKNQEDPANAGKVVAELRALREELRLQINGALVSPESQTAPDRPADRRWDDFDRWRTDFEDRMSAGLPDPAGNASLAALYARLEQINEALHRLPESFSLQSLEENVRVLASAIEHLLRQQDRQNSNAFAQIEERLDEISRAIVASTVFARAPHFDLQPFERIEARINSLARQIVELVDQRPHVEVVDRLNVLSHRIDEVAALADLPRQAVERLAEQLAAISEKLDGASSARIADQLLAGIDQRFEMLSRTLGQRQDDAMDNARALFGDIERRLDEAAGRLDRLSASDRGNMDTLQAIDQRFTDFVRKLEERAGSPGDNSIRGLETRLDEISERLDSSPSHAPGLDPELIRNLEIQITGLSAHLARSEPAMPEFESIGPRLYEIERSIAGSRDAMLETAQQAADDAVRSLAGSSLDAAAVIGLADDLKALESLTRRSDERNSRTFEAIHDTLLKIVDRLGSVETGAPKPEQPEKPALDNAPSIEAEVSEPAAQETLDIAAGLLSDSRSEPAVRTPAEAAAAAAVAALSTDQTVGSEPGGRVRSMLGSLSRAFGGRKDKEEPPFPDTAAPVEADAKEVPSLDVDLDEPLDPAIANRPLAPGSGAPDLSAIIKRVRDERRQPSKAGGPDAAKADFIAAARRAAQAAAAEADILKKNSDNQVSTGRLKLGQLFGAKRKTILLSATAIMLALTGIQLGRTFLTDGKEVAEQGAPQDVSKAATSAAAPVAGEPASDDAAAGRSEPAPGAPHASEQTSGNSGEPQSASGETVNIAPPAMAVIETEAAAGTASAPTVGIAAPEAATATPEIGGVVAATPNAAGGSNIAPAIDAAVLAAPARSIPVEAGPAPLREAAEAGDAKAIFEIGSRYADGRGVIADMTKAAQWYEKSAELGFAPAQYRAGNFYEKGLGVTRDVKKAKALYQLAAAQGNASAMHNLAVLFAMGADGAPDNNSAARWFMQAAELGVRDSQFNLGILAAKGVGVPQNFETSYKWFAVAAKSGDSDAAAKRDEIAKTLRPDQLERARAAADAWKPKAVDAEANSVEIPDAWQASDDTTASIDKTKVVEGIQRVLIRNGYDAGGADGVMGAKTKAAIAAFQGDNGMAATGEVDDKLVRTLLDKK